ncbi:MAG: DUF3857 domain-containing protein [Acidobacteriaceae bacterium]|nr:DUF3857 domain-containing protein [Acidobacteriaceae bacterium]
MRYKALAGLLYAACGMLAAEDTPQWVRDAAAVPVPKYEAKVPGVVILSEQTVNVDESGRRLITTRYAYRPLTREGKRRAHALEAYVKDTGKVRELRGWLVMKSGEVKKYGKDKAIDVAYSDSDVYNEYRARVIDAASDTDLDSLFAYEAVSEDKSIFTQLLWAFQDSLPVLNSRFTLALPQGWTADAVTFNAQPVSPSVSGSSYNWELRNLPFIDAEPHGPNVSGIAPRIGVTFHPPGPVKNAGPSFSTWADVSRFQSELADPQQTSSDELIAKAKALTANASTEWDRIAAIARYVQGVHYIEISTGLGRGGGYRPHPAAAVFQKAYGDCKDKANLMRTMLKVVGIPSYLVAIYSGDRTFAREQWPSPWQFNHMIVAVKVSPDVKAAPIRDDPKLGRLLFFDPTDEVMPLGNLPDYLQDSNALIVAGDAGALVRIPTTPPGANSVERNIEATLSAEGSLSARLTERDMGEAAANGRRRFIHANRGEYAKNIESWVTRNAGGSVVSKIEPNDQPRPDEFGLAVEWTSPRFGQLMQGRLLVFKPSIVSHLDHWGFAEPKRRYPIILDSESYGGTVHVKLPEGFTVDEAPGNVRLQTSFGTYAAEYECRDGVAIFKHALEVKATTIPPEQYAAVREFFGRVLGAEQASVVLVKK